MKTEIPWPPFKKGTKVLTLSHKATDFTADALKTRKWNVRGTIIKHHDSHGLSYEVKHKDGSVGHYNPDEIKVHGQLSVTVDF